MRASHPQNAVVLWATSERARLGYAVSDKTGRRRSLLIGKRSDGDGDIQTHRLGEVG
ncbi:hypothetical protein TIFTF001_006471 [Ficus carica]|uniref:Uncharacterized protein n=1 Tax=Ficus carica TaxID=3494 RepID=A0AA87ZHI5_FICCA|nr:hypothetical protein TIFTF001_006471 [Ficus carica]